MDLNHLKSGVIQGKSVQLDCQYIGKALDLQSLASVDFFVAS